MPEPQFPPTHGSFEDRVEPVERLSPPGKHAQELMAVHLRDEHGITPFSLERHVYLGGARHESQHLSWDPGRESYRCDLCPVHVFGTSTRPTAETVERALHFSAELQPHLVGLRTQEEREEMARHFLAGDLNRERLRQLRGADAKRRAAKGARPTVEARRARLQPWLLDRVSEVGILERVLDEAVTMQRDDPAAWAQLCDQLPSRETIRDWWQDIDPNLRAEAFTTGKKRSKKST
jgi:hypothetical protein